MKIASRRQSVLDLVEDDFSQLKSLGRRRASRSRCTSTRSATSSSRWPAPASSVRAGPGPRRRDRGAHPDTVATDGEFKRVGQMQMDVMAMASPAARATSGRFKWARAPAARSSPGTASTTSTTTTSCRTEHQGDDSATWRRLLELITQIDRGTPRHTATCSTSSTPTRRRTAACSTTRGRVGQRASRRQGPHLLRPAVGHRRLRGGLPQAGPVREDVGERRDRIRHSHNRLLITLLTRRRDREAAARSPSSATQPRQGRVHAAAT